MVLLDFERLPFVELGLINPGEIGRLKVPDFSIHQFAPMIGSNALLELLTEAIRQDFFYKKDGFQVGYIEEDSQYLLYTRRIITQIVVEGKPPA
jgi:hypothetical protein